MIFFLQILAFLYLVVGIACPLLLILMAYVTKDPVLDNLSILGICKRTLLWALFWPLLLIFED